MNAAADFVKHFDTIARSFNAIKVSHILFSVRPKNVTPEGRPILTADVATDRIQSILSYAAADTRASERVTFYTSISEHTWFKASADYIFKRFVLTWLSSDYLDPLPCTPADNRSPFLEIPTSGDEQTICFSSPTNLKETKVDILPFCLLPGDQSFAAVDAIVITDRFIITVQVTISRWHTAKQGGFAEIKANIPTITNGTKKKALLVPRVYHG